MVGIAIRRLACLPPSPASLRRRSLSEVLAYREEQVVEAAYVLHALLVELLGRDAGQIFLRHERAGSMGDSVNAAESLSCFIHRSSGSGGIGEIHSDSFGSATQTAGELHDFFGRPSIGAIDRHHIAASLGKKLCHSRTDPPARPSYKGTTSAAVKAFVGRTVQHTAHLGQTLTRRIPLANQSRLPKANELLLLHRHFFVS